MIINNKKFESGTHIMAIINMTPDSFFAQSRATDKDVLIRCEKAIEDGAEVLDIGAQSTRPGHTPVSSLEEINRFSHHIKDIKNHFPEIPLSIDTYYHVVAKYALDNGADLINDIWGLQYDNGEMTKVIGEYNAACCLMHNANEDRYDDLIKDICVFLNKSLELANSAKIDPNKIVLDGGIGFAKNIDENWELLNDYDKLDVLGYPLLLGTSRKRMFGGNPEDRLQATLDSTLLACKKNILFVRVHDVKENKEVIDRYNAEHN